MCTRRDRRSRRGLNVLLAMGDLGVTLELMGPRNPRPETLQRAYLLKDSSSDRRAAVALTGQNL